MRKFLIIPALGALVVGGALTAATVQAQSTPTHMSPAMNHNSIQPETTLSISATAEVKAEPDVAFISGGVVSEARTAEEAGSTSRHPIFRSIRAMSIRTISHAS